METTEYFANYRQQLIESKLQEVLPVAAGLNREALAAILGNYIDRFQDLYAALERATLENRESEATIIRSINIAELTAEARSNLGILDQILPIQADAVDVIDWDLSPPERIFYDPSEGSPIRKARLTWTRYVEAMGKYMLGADPYGTVSGR